ncbi:MAG: phosphatidylglycerophosphatase A [Planctomycetota bacterium]
MTQRQPTLNPIGRAAVSSLGLGYCKPFPGTWGSTPPVAMGGLIVLLGLGPADTPWLFRGVMIALVVVASAACVLLGDQAEAHYRKKDPSPVVADEVAGQALAILLLPSAAFSSLFGSLFTLVLVFFAFRLFDITKPPPASGLQRIPGGWGILLDDLVAGVYAAILVIAAWGLAA